MLRAHHAPRVWRCAFTLIELLVVIAVIALLIAVLLPALGKARRSGRQAVTLARLHDIGVGAFAYSNDYKDKNPTLTDNEEKAFLGLSLMAKVNGIPPVSFINPNTQESSADKTSDDGRPILADLAGVEIENSTPINPASIPNVAFHCSFSYDNDIKLHRDARPVVYIGDRADYRNGRTFSNNWQGNGMCLLWTDQHAAYVKTRSMKDQSDPNIYHHNQWNGEGAGEARDGIVVTMGTLDTHLRFFSEEEDDALLTDP